MIGQLRGSERAGMLGELCSEHGGMIGQLRCSECADMISQLQCCWLYLSAENLLGLYL